MDDEYKRIYAAMLRGEPGSPFYRPFFTGSDELYRRVHEIVESNCKRSIAVREDARVFLTTNLYHMVVLPVAIRHERPGSRNEYVEEMLYLINADCAAIVDVAVDNAKNHGEQEVSGRIMLFACARAYEGLKAVAKEVWG